MLLGTRAVGTADGPNPLRGLHWAQSVSPECDLPEGEVLPPPAPWGVALPRTGASTAQVLSESARGNTEAPAGRPRRQTAPAQGTAFGGVAPRRSPLCAGSEPASSAEAMTSGNMCPLSTDVPQGRVLTTFPPSKLLTGVLVSLSSTFATPWPAKRACPLTVPSPL